MMDGIKQAEILARVTRLLAEAMKHIESDEPHEINAALLGVIATKLYEIEIRLEPIEELAREAIESRREGE